MKYRIEIDMEYVKKRIDQNIDVVSIAKEINVSKNTLHGRIKKELGEEYQISNRNKEMEKAMVEVKKMLQEGCTTKEMCNKTGKCIDTILKYKEILMARGEIQPYKVAKKEKEIKVVKEIPKEYEKKVITYRGWPYRMLETWRFSM